MTSDAVIPFDPVVHAENRRYPVYHGVALRSRWAHPNQPALLPPSRRESGVGVRLPECVVMRGDEWLLASSFLLVLFRSGGVVRPCVGCAPKQIQKVPPYQLFGSQCSCSFSPVFLHRSNTVVQTIEVLCSISMDEFPEEFDLKRRVLLHERV